MKLSFGHVRFMIPLLTRYCCGITSNMAEHDYYSLKVLELGAEARGISLQTDPPPHVIDQIKADVTKHRIVVFKDQGPISGQRHVEISQWFGDLESTFYKHPKSPHPDVFRVSNDDNHGCRGVGRTGWHIDGSFQRAPFAYSLYHIVSVPQSGATVFAPLTELIEKLGDDKRMRWERLWMVSDRRGGIVHPLIYAHPVTHKPVLCFHLGMTEAFAWDYGTDKERMTEGKETAEILKEILKELVKDNQAIQYRHDWKEGDFIMSDNLAVGHEAHPDTQLPREKVGLRIMHRTTIKGTTPPSKKHLGSAENTCPKQDE